MPQEINQPLLFLYWSGVATPMQQKLIEAWLAKSAHQELYYTWLQDWEEKYPQSLVDVDAAWDRMKNRSTPSQPILAPSTTVAPVLWWYSPRWLLAAMILIIVAVGYVTWPAIHYKGYQTGYGQTLRILLPDGSRVFLQANSELRISRFFFNRNERTVQLNGEASFSVRHQPDAQRFAVQTDNRLDVVVLGTEFVVAARQRQFQVALHSGKVLLRPVNKQMHSLALQPGDVFMVSSKGHAKLVHHQPTQQLMMGQQHLFVFDRNTLPEVLAMIQEQFGETIQLNAGTNDSYRITGQFRAKDTDELLTVVTGLTGYRLERAGKYRRLIP